MSSVFKLMSSCREAGGFSMCCKEAGEKSISSA